MIDLSLLYNGSIKVPCPLILAWMVEEEKSLAQIGQVV